jgi:hypothetical protein
MYIQTETFVRKLFGVRNVLNTILAMLPMFVRLQNGGVYHTFMSLRLQISFFLFCFQVSFLSVSLFTVLFDAKHRVRFSHLLFFNIFSVNHTEFRLETLFTPALNFLSMYCLINACTSFV